MCLLESQGPSQGAQGLSQMEDIAEVTKSWGGHPWASRRRVRCKEPGTADLRGVTPVYLGHQQLGGFGDSPGAMAQILWL